MREEYPVINILGIYTLYNRCRSANMRQVLVGTFTFQIEISCFMIWHYYFKEDRKIHLFFFWGGGYLCDILIE